MQHALFGLVITLIFIPACSDNNSKKTVEYIHYEATREDIPFIAQTRISTDLQAGDFTVHGWDKPLISVEKKKYGATQEALSFIESDIEKNESSIGIRTKKKRHTVDAFLSYDVKAPQTMLLKTIHNTIGNVTIDGMYGPLAIQTVSGSIRVQGARDDVELKTHSGSIQLDFVSNAQAKADVITQSGDIEIMHAPGDARITTESGAITMSQVSSAQGKVHIKSHGGRICINNLVTNLHLESSTGSVLVVLGDIKDHTKLSLSSKAGRVTVIIPRTINLSIDAHTESGSIRSDYPLNNENNRLSGIVGSKHATRNRLIIKTHSGNITIQKK